MTQLLLPGRQYRFDIGSDEFTFICLTDLSMRKAAALVRVKTAAIISVGTATIAAFVGAGGLWRAHFHQIRAQRHHAAACRRTPDRRAGAGVPLGLLCRIGFKDL